MKEKSKKRVASRNQSHQNKSYQRYRHLDSPPCNILWTLLKMVKERTKTKGPKEKEINDDSHGFTPER